MIKFYYDLASDTTNVALRLEQMGLPYQHVSIDTQKGVRHKLAFLAINPNAIQPSFLGLNAVWPDDLTD
jgi:GST-like protein